MVINIDTIKKALYELDITGLLAFPSSVSLEIVRGVNPFCVISEIKIEAEIFSVLSHAM